MARSQGLQGFLETRAEGPTFTVVALCMIARAAQFYSGSALQLAQLLGRAGLQAFEILTGVGLAVGAELLFAIAGRNWQSHKREARDAMARRGVPRAEKIAQRDHYLDKSRVSFWFMLIGLGASLTAAFSFLFGANGDHTPGAILSDILVSLLLVAVVAYLAIFKETRGTDPGEAAQEQARAARTSAIAEAGKRIASGVYAPRDVRVVARQLPRAERDKFEAALLPDDVNDPQWTKRDILAWLGDDSTQTRRRIERKLSRLYENGAGVLRDDATKSYRIPRSIALRHFAEEFLAAHAPQSAREEVQPRTSPALTPHQIRAVKPQKSTSQRTAPAPHQVKDTASAVTEAVS